MNVRIKFLTLLNHTRIRKVLENKSNMEDDRVGVVEAQLSQAKLIAEEADKKYEEVQKSSWQKIKFALEIGSQN